MGVGLLERLDINRRIDQHARPDDTSLRGPTNHIATGGGAFDSTTFESSCGKQIDTFAVDGYHYRLEGDWGRMEIESDIPVLTVD
jgi:hypothetical protein